MPALGGWVQGEGTSLPDLITLLLFFFFFCILGLCLRHMEVPRLRVKSEPQLPAYPTATATWDLSHACNLHHSSW